MSDEQLLDAFSTLNENDQPHLGTCTLVTGDGTVKVDFNNGRARVPARVASLIAQHPHVTIPALEGKADPEPEPEETEESEDETSEEETSEPDISSESDEEESEAVRLAKEHLAEEGEEVPDTEGDEPPREGFEATTADGAPRCQAAKADGNQCANPAVEGSRACRLGKHQEQLA